MLVRFDIMDTFILVGKIINTFGIKGEVKISSDFEYKNRIFKSDCHLYIGKDKYQEVVKSYRVHKNYDMVGFVNKGNINEVLKYKSQNVYVKRSELFLNDGEYLYKDIIGFQVWNNTLVIGEVIDYILNKGQLLWKIKGDKVFYIPNVAEYILKIDLLNKKIITNRGSDLII